MKNKLSFLRIASAATILLFVFTGVTYLDQVYQTSVVTDYSNLSKPKRMDKSTQHLKQLGFSEMAISHMSDGEIERFEAIKGEVVAERDIYREVWNNDTEHLSKENYEKRLKEVSESVLPKFSALQQVHLKLIDEGNRRVTAITEHHFDYNPASGKPLGIELQLRPEYTVIDHMARQISWTVPRFSHTITSSTEAVQDGQPPVMNDEFAFFDNSSTFSLFYTVPWKQSGLLKDTVGLHFFTITRFEVPADFLFADMYVQGQNPELSDVVQYELQSNE
ncbi:hypothetical protein [Bacillus sp. FJAT-27225]|uniref:hypothetical protein n=1 Tax=Bacillus sp. FJAT-27225 TaxID=1743144 RepID=UPI001112570E|nr:hypothetical protein [Bacillus sp. FJAT-27225]